MLALDLSVKGCDLHTSSRYPRFPHRVLAGDPGNNLHWPLGLCPGSEWKSEISRLDELVTPFPCLTFIYPFDVSAWFGAVTAMGNFSLLLVACVHLTERTSFLGASGWIHSLVSVNASFLGLPWLRNVSWLKIPFLFSVFKLFILTYCS